MIAKALVLGLIGLVLTTGLGAQTVEFEGFTLALGRGFTLEPFVEGQPLQLKTPSRFPISVLALVPQEGHTWESLALGHLLSNLTNLDPKITAEDRAAEIQIKREGPWTTIYWTYGGTRAYFGMYWGGRTEAEGALLFWACPIRAPGRPQYQSLSEVTKGVTVTLSQGAVP